MSEKRFTLEQWTEESLYYSDGEYSAHMSIGFICEKVEKKLNEQQATIEQLQEENQQLKRQNKALKDSSLTDAYFDYLESSATLTLKVAEEPEQFKFNKNCAKPYEIRSVSPNGVVRVGKKNSKVSWRMKDVREIYKELPPFEDFNRETLQGIINKFHTKFDNDVIGRIIYNIYNGTFEGLI